MEGKIKILIVEDDSFFAQLCSRMLEEEGFSVFIAIDGEEGLEMLEKEEPDLVILDLLLPTMNGQEVLKRIRENPNPKLAKTPVMTVTNLAQEDEREKCEALGIESYLVKASISADIFLAKIKEILNRKKVAQDY